MRNKRRSQRLPFSFITILGIILFLVISFVPYLYVFHQGLSHDSADWEAFGSYLSGVASIINIVLFVIITFLIHNLERRNKENEDNRMLRQEKYAHFLRTYEKLILHLHRLNAQLAVLIECSRDNPNYYHCFDSDLLSETYVSIKSLSNVMLVLLPNKDFSSFEQIINSYLEQDYLPIYSLLSNENSGDINVESVIEMSTKTIKSTSTAIKSLNEIVKLNVNGVEKNG